MSLMGRLPLRRLYIPNYVTYSTRQECFESIILGGVLLFVSSAGLGRAESLGFEFEAYPALILDHVM